MENNMTYTEWEKYWQNKYDHFPMGFAFSDKQFEEELERLGVKSVDDVVGIDYSGFGFIRKLDVEAYKKLNRDYENDKKRMMKNDRFMVDMFLSELADHEYGYTMDWTDALFATGITLKEFEANGRYQRLLAEAIKEYKKGEKNG